MLNITIEQCINRYEKLGLISICSDGNVAVIEEEEEDD